MTTIGGNIYNAITSVVTRPRRVLTVLTLTAMWCILWGTVSVANVASGLVVSAATVGLGLGTSAVGGIRIRPLLSLLWMVAVDLVRSTVDVAVEILTPTDRTEEAVVAVQLPMRSRDHFLLLIVAITLTPGTAVVDGDPDNGTLYLHILHNRRRAETIEHVERLADLACRALPLSETDPDARPAAIDPSPVGKETT